MKPILIEELTKLHQNPRPAAERRIYDYIAFIRSAQYSLAVSSGKEAVELFLRSKRICEDISFAELNAGESFDLRIEVREWCPEIFPEREFRLFVWKKKLVAISQYYSDVFVPELSKRREDVSQKIQSFYQTEIQPKLPKDVQNLTVDVALSEDFSKVFLIEVGNPPPVAGTALFDWESDFDQQILKGNSLEDQVEFRLLARFDPEVKMHASVETIIQNFHGTQFPVAPLVVAVGLLLLCGFAWTKRSQLSAFLTGSNKGEIS